MVNKDVLSDEAREYLKLRRQEEIECLKRHIEFDRKAAEREELGHQPLMKKQATEMQCVKKNRMAPPPLPNASSTSPTAGNNSTCAPSPVVPYLTPPATGNFHSIVFNSNITLSYGTRTIDTHRHNIPNFPPQSLGFPCCPLRVLNIGFVVVISVSLLLR